MSRVLATTLLMLAGAISRGADPGPTPPAVKVLTVGGVALSLTWDRSWLTDDSGSAEPGTVKFHTKDPLRMATTLGAGEIPANATPDDFRAWVMEKSSKELLNQSVEKHLDVVPVGSGDVRGSKVCATDRAPKPDEYKYICQGVLTRDSSVVFFWVLYNESGKSDAEKALAAVEGLQFPTGT